MALGFFICPDSASPSDWAKSSLFVGPLYACYTPIGEELRCAVAPRTSSAMSAQLRGAPRGASYYGFLRQYTDLRDFEKLGWRPSRRFPEYQTVSQHAHKLRRRSSL